MPEAQVLLRIQIESDCLAERKGAREEGALSRNLLERARKVEKREGKDTAQSLIASVEAID